MVTTVHGNDGNHSFISGMTENVRACCVHINILSAFGSFDAKISFPSKLKRNFQINAQIDLSAGKWLWHSVDFECVAVSVSNACLISIARSARNILVCFAMNTRRSKSKAKWTRTLVLLLLLLLLFPQSAVIFIFFAVVSCSDAHGNYNEAQPANNQSEWQRRQ